MADYKLKQSLGNLNKALSRLGEALQEDQQNSLIVDGTIQRFEFTIELFLKRLKRALKEEGVESGTPKETLKEAYQLGWLSDEQAWLQMLRDRNETSHTYDEEKAFEILTHINGYYPELIRTIKFLQERYLSDDT